MSGPSLAAPGPLRTWHDLLEPAPRALARRCESCGSVTLTVFVAGPAGGGRRMCSRCLGVFDQLRRRVGNV